MPITRLNGRTKLGLAAAGLFLVGGGAGAAVMHATRPPIEMAPVRPVPIARAADFSGPITLRGRVSEVYGSKFVLQDNSGKALIDVGPRGNRSASVTLGAVETVQGRYDDGVVHASFLVDPSGEITALGPLRGPHPEPRGPHHGGHDGARRPSLNEDGAPPPPHPMGSVPPPPAAGQAAPAPAAAPQAPR